MTTATRERPINFNAQMVRAIIRGDKTQARRVIKPQAHHYNDDALGQSQIYACGDGGDSGDPGTPIKCPYGKPGERLWVRETWTPVDHDFSDENEVNCWLIQYKADGGIEWRNPPEDVHHRRILSRSFGTANIEGGCHGRWIPPLNMHRWASRILLEVVAVRVERIRSISAEDARAEGTCLSEYEQLSVNSASLYTSKFVSLWDSINTRQGPKWGFNPWVWVVEFKKLETSHDD